MNDELNKVEAEGEFPEVSMANGAQAGVQPTNNVNEPGGNQVTQNAPHQSDADRAKQLRTARLLIIIPSIIPIASGMLFIYITQYKHYADVSGLLWAGNTLVFGMLFFMCLLTCIPCIAIGLMMAMRARKKEPK